MSEPHHSTAPRHSTAPHHTQPTHRPGAGTHEATPMDAVADRARRRTVVAKRTTPGRREPQTGQESVTKRTKLHDNTASRDEPPRERTPPEHRTGEEEPDPHRVVPMVVEAADLPAQHPARDTSPEQDRGPDGRTPARKRSATELDDGAPREADAAKRQKAVDARSTLPPLPTLPALTVRQHLGLRASATVRLAPGIVLDNGAIKRIDLAGRTPSPFGGPMGDHTTAWTVVTDSVRARLHGLSLPDAVAALRAAHTDVSDWMAKGDSPMRNVLEALPADRVNRTRLLENEALPADRVNRTRLLENEAWHVTTLLDSAAASARAATSDRDRATAWQQLADAVAHHLTYRNYLPFATVEAATATGSKGGAEGQHRAAILDHERSDESLPGQGSAGAVELREHLWGLFDIRAAVRSSGAHALLDGTAELVTRHRARFGELRTELLEVLREQIPFKPPALDGDLRRIHADAGALLAEAVSVLSLDADLQVVNQAALDIMVIIEGTLTRVDTERRATREKRLKAAQTAFAGVGPDRDRDLDAIRARIDSSLPQVALVLARLLHEHQHETATAYGKTVLDSGFLGRDDGIEQAIAKLQDALDDVPGALTQPDLRSALQDAVAVRHRQLGPITRRIGNWARDATVERLVVTYRPGGTPPLVVNGRAPAPSGFQGMGAHSTAWIVEIMAVERMVGDAGSPEEAVRRLQQHVVADLGSNVMRIGHLLPGEQLGSGQLADIVAAAHTVFSVGSAAVADAVREYLRFRNLLPYATNDVADTSGHGESRDASESDSFDRNAVQGAVDLVKDELSDPARLEEVNTFRARAADDLAERWSQLPELADADQQGALEQAVTDAVEMLGLTLTADPRKADDPGFVAVGSVLDQLAGVLDTREAEHGEVYDLAHVSRPRSRLGPPRSSLRPPPPDAGGRDPGDRPGQPDGPGPVTV